MIPFGINQKLSFPQTKKLTTINVQFLGPKNDLEKLVDEGLQKPDFLKVFLRNTWTISILEYAEKKIKSYKKLDENMRGELLKIINEHPLKKQQTAE
ncbi:MAG: hypothetical protein WC606_01015 [Candidatus Absconditabacterales bacterium]|jgi:ABC-type molybdate transport system substrate-binding protein